MNRFKTKKKGPKDDTPATRPSLESESSFNLFRRGKKNQEQEQKKDVDLTTALPSEDDFRTSLLMSGLSARFSMLREQDDPSTKIGKASDDSVLFPNRQSRLAGLGFSGTDLGDIAEVSSIRAPPFLRADSVASTDSGSVMTRSKPTEGNVLFGGRQKVYKITAGTSSSRNLGDGMGGRTLYDNDVSMSAFQRWRQTEKDKGRDTQGPDDGEEDQPRASDGERMMEDSSFLMRSESPLPNGYNKNRETSSTTSSTPSGGRNSTAATSVISQPTAFTKDNHSQPSMAMSSTTSTPALERHVTRTRRLYEQGLTQDLQEQQHSVLSRVDTLTRRPGGARTPEIGPNSPSPTMQAFSDRFAAYGSERRTVLSKGSAPNLRSMSPPATGPLNGTMDLNTRVSNQTDSRGNFSPPLSPPISDAGTGDLGLHIQPQDHGKATAMNVFQKPVSPYDDVKYAERQRQLQQGRETPTHRFRDESMFSLPNRSQSSASSIRKESSEAKSATVSPKMIATSFGESVPVASFDETLESPILNDHVIKPSISPQVRLERPSDNDHPAFRQSTVPAPLALPSHADEAQLPRPDSGYLTVGTHPAMLADSPTLGPNGGLSGMVRQHLRSGSDVSSIYGPQVETPLSASRLESTPASSTTWEEQDWNISQGHDDERSPAPKLDNSAESSCAVSSKPMTFLESPRSPDEEDEFANQLANARRRVREKLTSFVETDSAPVTLSPPLAADQASDLPLPPSRSNPLGILRGKGSFGSLIDRGRDAAPKPLKEVGSDYDREARLQEEENAHPSLRAFRQARRELQKGKEFEAMAKRSAQPHAGQFTTPTIPETPMSSANEGNNELPRTGSIDHLPSGIRQQRQMNYGPRQGMPLPPPRSQSRPPRDRSGSENSDGSGRSRSRPSVKPKEHPSPIDEQHKSRDVLNHPSMRMAPHPGLPGTDVKRSPIMPANGSSRMGRPVGPSHLESINTGFKPMPGRSVTEPTSAATSPLSQRSGPIDGSRSVFQPNGAGGSAPITPSGPMSRRPSIPTSVQPNGNGSTLTDSMKRIVNKKDISEPTFLMSTSRVPTTSLPQSAIEAREDRPRAGNDEDYGSPPPLPPVNPRRRNTRTGETDNVGLSASTPHLPIAPSPTSAFAQSPSEERHPPFSMKDDAFRRKLRKVNSEMRMDARAAASPRRASPPQVAIGPPAGRAVMMAPNKRGPQPHLPGGMF